MRVARNDALGVGCPREGDEVVIAWIGRRAGLCFRISGGDAHFGECAEQGVDLDGWDRPLNLGRRSTRSSSPSSRGLTITSNWSSAHLSGIFAGLPVGASTADTYTLASRTTRRTQRREACCSRTASSIASSSPMPSAEARRSARIALTRSRPLKSAR
jgi:hypothetical protein